MKKELVKTLIVTESADLMKQKYLYVYDGTGEMTPKGNAEMTLEQDGKLYYIPFSGTLFKAKFPELNSLHENGEITDKETIQKIKENLF